MYRGKPFSLLGARLCCLTLIVLVTVKIAMKENYVNSSCLVALQWRKRNEHGRPTLHFPTKKLDKPLHIGNSIDLIGVYSLEALTDVL
jgi:hypothetical protein